MGRAAAGFLILLALAPSALGQTLHEDFSRVDDDEEILRAWAARVLARSTESLDQAIKDDPGSAARAVADAGTLSLAMQQAAHANASAATSARGLAPFAVAARGLAENATVLSEDWAAWQNLTRKGFTTRHDALQGQLLLGSLRQAIEGALEASDAYERLGFDVDSLREVVSRFFRLIDAQVVPPVEEGEGAPALFLEVVPWNVTVTRPLVLRGVLVGEEEAGNRTVRFEVDGAPWGEAATTDRGGFFSARRVADASLGVGGHVARASVATAAQDLWSNDAGFTILPLATRLSLSLPAARLPLNLTVPLSARLVDEDGVPVGGTVTVSLDGGTASALQLGPSGTGARDLNTTLLGLGPHEAVAEFAGDALHAPSRAAISFEVVPEIAPPTTRLPRPFLAFLAGDLAGILLVLFLLHLVLLVGLGRRFPRAFLASAAAGPVVLLMTGAGLRLPLPATLGLAGAALLASLGMGWWHHRRHAIPSTPPSVAEVALPAPLSSVAPERPADADPLQDLLDIHGSILARLAAEGMDVRPLTHREVAGALRARRYPEEAVRALTHALERALYAGVPPRAEDVAPVRAAFAAMGVSA